MIIPITLYSKPRGKTDKLEEPVKRELDNGWPKKKLAFEVLKLGSCGFYCRESHEVEVLYVYFI